MRKRFLGLGNPAATLRIAFVAAAKRAALTARVALVSARSGVRPPPRRWAISLAHRNSALLHIWTIGIGLLWAGLPLVLTPELTLAGPVGGTDKAISVIIDTDVGDDIDDAFALAMALSDSRLKVIGITTAWGDTHTRTLLVRRLLATLGRDDIIVAEGPATASSIPFTQRQWALRTTDTSPAPDAIEFLRNEVNRHPGTITLIALAPLTNLQALSEREPGAIAKFRQVVIMGGSIYAGYQKGGAIPVATPSAEYNVVSAPRAFATLLAAGVPVKLFPLDSTQIKFDEVRRDRLFAYGSPASDALTLLYHQWRLLNSWGQLTPTLFDVVPVAWLLKPSTCDLVSLRLTVNDEGFTLVTPGAPNVAACLTVNENALQHTILDTLAPEPRRNTE